MTSTIVIEVNGGVLTEVHNLPLGCRVMLIDWDDIDSDPGLFWREASNEQREFIKKEYVKTTLARMSRIFPAFGIGGVVNKYVRKIGNEHLREVYGKKL